MQSALLKQNSYAKFSLNDRNAQVDNNPTTVKLGKELNAIRLSFIPFGRDGMLFQFSSEYPQNVWLACGIEKGQMVLFFGKVTIIAAFLNTSRNGEDCTIENFSSNCHCWLIWVCNSITFYLSSCIGQKTAKRYFGLHLKLPPARLFTTLGRGLTLPLLKLIV